ncbi:hypothetical protein NHQ30_009080 [Ciborinia camelliae]|nr:hypothetical protein NHQ30_009080 [Ciborinia camelliae]
MRTIPSILEVRPLHCRKCSKRRQSAKGGKHTLKIKSTTTDINHQKQTDAPAYTTFTLFPNLPLELQRKIWEFAIPDGRIIEIHSQDENRMQRFVAMFSVRFVRYCRRLKYHIPTTPIQTGLFHTCRESRNAIMRIRSLHTFFGRLFYINEDADLLWISGDLVIKLYSMRNTSIGNPLLDAGVWSQNTNVVRYFAIDYYTNSVFYDQTGSLSVKPWWYSFIWTSYLLTRFTLERIYLVYTNQDQQQEVEEAAKLIFDCGKDIMAIYGQPIPPHYRLLFGSWLDYHQSAKLRREQGLELNMPTVEAILDTELRKRY